MRRLRRPVARPHSRPAATRSPAPSGPDRPPPRGPPGGARGSSGGMTSSRGHAHGIMGRDLRGAARDRGRRLGRPGPAGAHGGVSPRWPRPRAERRVSLFLLRRGRCLDDQDDGLSARAPEPEDVVRICRALNQAGARYLLIGGFAVVAHGAGRFTKDIDLLVDDSPTNVARVKDGLAILADNAASDVAEEDVRRHVVVRVADEVIVDLMGRACGLSYAEASRDAETDGTRWGDDPDPQPGDSPANEGHAPAPGRDRPGLSRGRPARA